MAQLINRYAVALFELSLERGAIETALEQALFLRKILSEKECQAVITHPRITAVEKRRFFDDSLKGHISQEIMGFLHLTVDKNREAFIIPILSEFITMANCHLGKTTALVITAAPLKDSQKSTLVNLLSKKLNKKVELSEKVDSSVIGGLYVQVDGYFIDRTLKTRIKEMTLTMKGVGK